MPKQKTHSGTKDRVRITKTGKVMHRHASGHHNLEKKSESRKRRFAGMETLTGKQAKTTKKRLGV
jgi:large subunit ribosomal protein L35